MQTITFYAIITISIICSALFIIWQESEKPFMSLLLKLMASLSFIAIAIFSNYLNKFEFISASFLTMGLIVSLIGDGLLAGINFKGLNKPDVIKSGMVAFGIAQIFYYIALVLWAGFSWISLLIGVVIALAIAFGEKLLKLNYGKTRYFTIAYSLLLGCTVGQAIMSIFIMGATLSSVLFLIGFVLFFLSDLVLSLIYFKEQPKKCLTYINLFLYYSAQILIACSLFYI